ncbi:hypothetical protein Tco_1029314 [Tanacetum coccineum]|uniref:Uncharacterized protein n=1 Tax=Tanacetum coccineum TaxID=301880 RepID=A0ABQ5G4M3_9ASTR
MNDVFVSVENDLDETFKQNELLKDRLLEASLAEDIKNLVITSCVEIRNKDLHDEIDRISKESKDVSNESKTADTVCNDAFEVTQGLSKRIVELEKDLSKFEAKSIAFEIALQHKSKVETNQCDEVKVKDNFDEIETKNIELEYRVATLIKENEHLKLTYKNLFDSIKKSRVQTKTSNVTQNEAENLKSQLFEFAETKFSNILEKIEFFKKSPGEKQHLFENKTSVFQIKIDELEKVLTQQTKDFNAVKLELSNRTAKFEAYFEKLKNESFDMQKSLSKPVTAQSLSKNKKDQLLKRIAYLESKLASQDIRSCHALKVKFDSLNRKRRETNVSKSSKPRESASEKGFKTRASNAKNQFFEASHSCFTPVKQVWRPIKESQTFEASTSQKSFKTSTLKGKNQVFVTPHSRFTPVKQVWRPKQSHSKSFTYSKSEMLSMQNKNDSASTINKKGRFSNDAKTNFRNVSSNDNKKWKSSSSTRFKNPQETPSFNNQWKIKRNFKSPLIPRELFSNETPVSSPRWNSTSLHRIDTTLKWFSKLGKPVSTVLKWVPKVVV